MFYLRHQDFTRQLQPSEDINSISLNKGEVFFLQQLAKYGYAKNNELVHFYEEGNADFVAATTCLKN